MALGKNIKRSKLIPDPPATKEKEEVVKQEENVMLQEQPVLIEENKEVNEAQPQDNAGEHEEVKCEIKPSRRKKVKKVKVVLGGKLVLRNVEYVKEMTLPLFDSYDYVDFVLNEVEDLDLTCIQLLHYYKALFQGENKQVTIDAELDNDLKEIITISGHKDLLIKPKLA